MLRIRFNTAAAAGVAIASSGPVRQRIMLGQCESAAVSIALPDRIRDMFALSSGIGGVSASAIRARMMTAVAAGAASAFETFDPDVVNWWTAIGTSNISLLTVAAADDIVVGLKAAGLWTNIYMLDLCCGNGLTQALTRLKVPGGVSASYTNAGFTSGNYAERGSTGGMTGDANTKYLNSLINPSALGWSATSFGVFVYVRTTETAPGGSGVNYTIFGSDTSSSLNNETSLTNFNGGNDRGAIGGNNQHAGGSPGNNKGFYGVVTNGSASAQLYRNGSAIGSAASMSGGFFSGNLLKHGLNQGGSPVQLTERTLSTTILTSGLSGAQVTALYNLVQAFETALGRNV